MQQIKPLLFAVGACSLLSCNQESISPTGYEYIHHIQNTTTTAQAGDEVFFHVDLFHDSQLVESSRDKGHPAKMVLPSRQKGVYSPIAEALSLMSVGDSLTIFSKIDTLYTKYAMTEAQKKLEYHLKLIEIQGNRLENTPITNVEIEASPVLAAAKNN